MAKLWESVKINVFLGYITLIIISSITIWVIYSETLELSESKVDLNPVNNKILFANSILTNLYQVESLERSFLQTDKKEYYQDYNELMDSISLQIDSLALISERTCIIG